MPSDREIENDLDRLYSRDWVVRRDAARALGGVANNPRVSSALASAFIYYNSNRSRLGLNAEEKLVLAAFADALGRIRNARAVPDLIGALNASDSRSEIYPRSDIARALGNIGDARAIPALAVALRENRFYREYVDALGAIADVRAVPVLMEALSTDTSGHLRDAISKALAKIGTPDTVLRQILLCSTMDLPARVSTLNSLRYEYREEDGLYHRYKTPEARQYCQEMESDSDPEVRKAAEEMRRYIAREAAAARSVRSRLRTVANRVKANVIDGLAGLPKLFTSALEKLRPIQCLFSIHDWSPDRDRESCARCGKMGSAVLTLRGLRGAFREYGMAFDVTVYDGGGTPKKFTSPRRLKLISGRHVTVEFVPRTVTSRWSADSYSVTCSVKAGKIYVAQLNTGDLTSRRSGGLGLSYSISISQAR